MRVFSWKTNKKYESTNSESEEWTDSSALNVGVYGEFIPGADQADSYEGLFSKEQKDLYDSISERTADGNTTTEPLRERAGFPMWAVGAGLGVLAIGAIAGVVCWMKSRRGNSHTEGKRNRLSTNNDPFRTETRWLNK